MTPAPTINGKKYSWKEVYEISSLCQEDFQWAYSECYEELKEIIEKQMDVV